MFWGELCVCICMLWIALAMLATDNSEIAPLFNIGSRNIFLALQYTSAKISWNLACAFFIFFFTLSILAAFGFWSRKLARPLLMPWLDWFHCAWCLLTFAGSMTPRSPLLVDSFRCDHLLELILYSQQGWEVTLRKFRVTINVCPSGSDSASLTPFTSVTTPCSACILCIGTKALFGCSSIATNPHAQPSHRYYTASFRELQRMESVSRRWDVAGRCKIKEGCPRLLFQNIYW